MSFEETLLNAKQGDDNEFNFLLSTYRRKIRYFSYFNGKYDDELEGEMLVTFLRCIKTFRIDYEKPN
jgi:hypothetical protein